MCLFKKQLFFLIFDHLFQCSFVVNDSRKREKDRREELRTARHITQKSHLFCFAPLSPFQMIASFVFAAILVVVLVKKSLMTCTLQDLEKPICSVYVHMSTYIHQKSTHDRRISRFYSKIGFRIYAFTFMMI